MIDWIMAHPWLTFFFAVIAVYILDNMVTNICNSIVECRRLKSLTAAADAEKEIKKEELKNAAQELYHRCACKQDGE